MTTETGRHWQLSRHVVLLAVALLVVAYGDGLAAGLQARFNLPSPWTVLFPLLLLSLLGYMAIAKRGFASPQYFQIEVLLWSFALGLGLQLLVHGTINVAGYLQLAIFVIALAAVRFLFARAPHHLLAALGPAVLVAHLFLCGYVLATVVAWNFAGVDISIRTLLASTPSVINAYYGYRPGGWGAEPAWTALAIAVSYTATYYLMPSTRGAVLGLTALTAVALQSGTLFLFLALVAGGLLARRHTRLAILAGVLMVAAVPLLDLGAERIEAVVAGRDPSVMMRASSARVAIDVMSGSFPLGVGYGNFREGAIYGREFENFLDLDAAPYYKSDVLVLNFVSELGVGGLLILVYVFRLLGFGRLLLPTIFLSLLALLSGTVLIPALFVLAAVRGSQDQAELEATREGTLDGLPHGIRSIVPPTIDVRTGPATQEDAVGRI